MQYERITVYFWSGTGNTYRLCRKACDMAESRGAASVLASIGLADPPGEMGEGPSSLLVVAAPTHGFTAPWPMIKFCLRLPRKRSHAAVVTTRGGAYPGFYLRGLSASNTFVLALVLRFKGYALRGILSTDMPQNWTAVVPGLNEEHNRHFIERSESRVAAFFNDVFSGRRRIASLDNLFEFMMGLLLLPVSFLYLMIGRFFLAKLFFANYTCNSCGLCALHCPHRAIVMKGGDVKRPYWTYRCEGCGRCINYCPLKAIEAGHSLGVMLYFAGSFPASLYLVNLLVKFFPWVANLRNKYILWFLDYPFKLAAFFLCYLVLYYLIRVPLVNRFFTFTTGTHWFRRYHEPDVSLAELRSKKAITGKGEKGPSARA